MKGTKFGKMVIPGDPMGSNLMWLLDWRGAPETRMPHGKKKLSTCDRDAIRMDSRGRQEQLKHCRLVGWAKARFRRAVPTDRCYGDTARAIMHSANTCVRAFAQPASGRATW